MICVVLPFSPVVPLIVSLAFMSEWCDADGTAAAAMWFPFVKRTDAIGNVLIVLKLDSSKSRWTFASAGQSLTMLCKLLSV